MKKKVTSAVIIFAMLVGVLHINVWAANPEMDQYLHRCNVVFVTDESGSMNKTDPTNNRYEAIKLFLGEMANDGNYVGSISFADDIINTTSIRLMDGQSEKDALYESISNPGESGHTNIGLGLLEAVKMLDSGGDESLDSAIILLTDGNTWMPEKEQRQLSLEMKAEAIEMARKAGYKIYTICLNVNGNADAQELRQIAEATGGEFVEVNDSADLNDVETMFNKLIFKSFEDMKFADMELAIGQDGAVKTDFEIPGIGVEEINVLFQGKLKNCELVDSEGVSYKKGVASAVVVEGSDFQLIKVANPNGGKWQAIGYGDPDTVIRLRLLYNSNFYVDAHIETPDVVHVGDKIRVVAKIGTSAGIVTDTKRYQDITAVSTVKYRDQVTEHTMDLTDEGFVYEMSVEDEGTYYINVAASNSEMKSEEDETFEINVDNLPPTPSGEELSAHANIWPVIGGSASLNLSGAAIDPEGQELSFAIESTAFAQGDYKIEGDKITVIKYSIPKGSFTVRATDPYGAYCTFDVMFTSTNIGLVMAITTLIGIIIALIVILLLLKAALEKALMGTLSVSYYDKSRKYPPQVKDHGRGRISLNQFAIDVSSLPKGCKFQCDGRKRQVWFISKKPVYSDNSVGATKKIRIMGDGMEVRICGDNSMEKGIIVSFKSDLPDPMGMTY